MDVQVLRERLESRLRELEGSVATLESEGPVDDSAELSHYDQHPADAASTLSEADREEALKENARMQVEDVRAALARMDAGTYGRCVDCGQALPEERLEARPEAARCVTDQSRHEAGR